MTRPDLVDALQAALADSPRLARDLAKRLGSTRSEINSALYSHPKVFVPDTASPPKWRLAGATTTKSGIPSTSRPPRSKQETIDAILDALGSSATLTVGPGSTEPKAIFTEVVGRLQLRLDTRGSKVDLARGIVSLAGRQWPADGDSTKTPSGGGDTVTLSGLIAVLDSTRALLGGLHAPAAEPAIPTVGGVPYTVASGGIDAEPIITLTDWDALDKATRAHMELQNRIAEVVAARGLSALKPAAGDPKFDIAWKPRGRFVVCEVKSSTPTNARQQLRLGLGQVLEYRSALTALLSIEVVAAISCEEPPPAETRRAITSAGVRLLLKESLEVDIAPLL